MLGLEYTSSKEKLRSSKNNYRGRIVDSYLMRSKTGQTKDA